MYLLMPRRTFTHNKGKRIHFYQIVFPSLWAYSVVRRSISISQKGGFVNPFEVIFKLTDRKKYDIIYYEMVCGGVAMAVNKYTAKNGKNKWYYSVRYKDWTGEVIRKKTRGLQNPKRSQRSRSEIFEQLPYRCNHYL